MSLDREMQYRIKVYEANKTERHITCLREKTEGSISLHKRYFVAYRGRIKYLKNGLVA